MKHTPRGCTNGISAVCTRRPQPPPRSGTTPTAGPGLLGHAVRWDGRQSPVIASDRAEIPIALA